MVPRQEDFRVPQSAVRDAGGGFSLVSTISLLALLTVVMLGMLSLSVITVRSSSQSSHDLEARTNARLAMMMALGELQKHLGPDQRVSAPAALLDSDPDSPSIDGVRHPHWVGVWSHLDEDGNSLWVRDDINGGLKDRRDLENWDREKESISYLVSGNEGGRKSASNFRQPLGPDSDLSKPVRMVGPGSLGDDQERLREGGVDVERVPVASDGKGGHYAYWVGDLGTRANIATPNRHETSPDDELGDLFEVMTSQEANSEVMSAGGEPPQRIEENRKDALVSARQVDLLDRSAKTWREAHFHDLTVHSRSVLADVKNGGLKRDLTAYFQSIGAINGEGTKWTQGISDEDNIIGPANPEAARSEELVWANTRHRFTSPKFGLLRKWALLSQGVPQGDAGVQAIVPKPEPRPRNIDLEGQASANLKPASIASLDAPNLMPVLVEGSMYSVVSWHRNPPGSIFLFNIRLHAYPRVVLWNCYNVELTVEDLMVLLHVNGRKEMATEGIRVDRFTGRPISAGLWYWIWFVGGRSNELHPGQSILDSNLYKDPYIGSFYFALEKTTLGPGECLVFTPDKAAEYDNNALEKNTLSASVAPDPDLNYYFTASELDGGMNFYPTTYWFVGTDAENERGWNIKNQADDFRMMLKDRGSESGITPQSFDLLPQVSYVSCSMQFGAGREPRFAWSRNSRETMYETDLATARWLPRLGQPSRPIPNVRTRDGYRLRWFQEHPSNLLNSGELKDEPHFDTAHLANWNPRASYSFRTPWDNLAGEIARTGSGPWFFGSYTRDLFDQAVSWNDMMPVPRDGRFHGNPFGQPIEGRQRNILFDVPRRGTGVMSLAQLQHAKLSEFSWHPAYAVGQSLVDPRVGTASSAPEFESESEEAVTGWDSAHLGWSPDGERSGGREQWARFGRALAQNYAETDHLVYDLSYEANHNLWDSFFLSTGSKTEKRRFLDDPVNEALPNGRHVLADRTRDLAGPEELSDFHRAAYHLLLHGGFNVNSTSVEAWKALLAATRNSGYASPDHTPFPRVINPPDVELLDGAADDPAAWSGFRSLSDPELELLASEIVREVKARGPFLTLADFVNRRLVKRKSDQAGHQGALQAAIEAAGLNADFEIVYPLENEESLDDYQHPDNIKDPTRLEQSLKPASKAWGAPGYLTQGDLLQVVGPALTARSDTFMIRAYGDSVDENGAILARAWCEVVVQRTPVPVNPTRLGLNPDLTDEKNDFGRRFAIQSFRWLNPGEI